MQKVCMARSFLARLWPSNHSWLSHQNFLTHLSYFEAWRHPSWQLSFPSVLQDQVHLGPLQSQVHRDCWQQKRLWLQTYSRANDWWQANQRLSSHSNNFVESSWRGGLHRERSAGRKVDHNRPYGSLRSSCHGEHCRDSKVCLHSGWIHWLSALLHLLLRSLYGSEQEITHQVSRLEDGSRDLKRTRWHPRHLPLLSRRHLRCNRLLSIWSIISLHESQERAICGLHVCWRSPSWVAREDVIWQREKYSRHCIDCWFAVKIRLQLQPQTLFTKHTWNYTYFLPFLKTIIIRSKTSKSPHLLIINKVNYHIACVL